MNTLGLILSIIGGLAALAAVSAGVYATFKGTAADKRIERLQGERDDYLSRLNFIEPRYAALEEQNQTLRTLYDPSARLVELGAAVESNAKKVLAVLDRQAATLEEIKQRVHVDPTTGRGD